MVKNILGRIKLIAFDVDGTILKSDHQLSPYTYAVLKKLQDTGTAITLATGKLLPAIQGLASSLNVCIPMILANGSVIQTMNGEIITAQVFSESLAREILGILDTNPSEVVVITAHDLYVKEISASVRDMMQYGPPIPKIVIDWEELGSDFTQIVKFMALDQNSPDNLRQLLELLRRMLKNRAEVFPSLYYMVEITPSGVNKGTALKHLAGMLGIESEAIMAFGDGDNDAEMLEFAGYGVAVSDSSPLCVSVADEVIGSSDEDSPARFLDELINELRGNI